MCGIAGIVSSGKKDVITKMTAIMAHRGPDEEGYYRDDRIALGQRRLSIIDLDGGRQPISNENGKLQLICNGEIYNSPELRKGLIDLGHSFKTQTDVEVILHLYEEHGLECVKYLRGMFAFALWDLENHTLMLARDHLGQKPLFFHHQNGLFTFASEVKGLLATEFITPEIDLEGLWHYVSLRFLPDRYTLFKSIQKLPAASYLIYKEGKVTIEKYWELDFTKKLPEDENTVIEGLEDLLLKTVKEHLLSDVQVGAFLSGGIDSSTISAMTATISGDKLPTFTIGVKEQGFNELPYAKMVSDKYKLDAHEKNVEPDLIGMIPSMVWHMDEPSDPFGVGVYLISEVASKFVKVVLSGDGGDENFAGYDRFIGQLLADYYSLLPKWIRKSVMKRIIDYIPETYAYKSFAQKAAWINEMSFFSGGERYAQSLSTLRFTQDAKRSLFTSKARGKIIDDDSIAQILKYFNAENADHVIDKMLYTDLMTRMPDHLLVLVDRMSMAHSIESRSPLIDYKVVEYAASIPAGMKLKNRKLKYILKQVASRYLPQELINRRKQGFAFPLGIWMRNDLKVFLKNIFSESRFVELGIFNQDYMLNILNEHISGKADHNFRIWILLNLEIWYRLYCDHETIDSIKDYIKCISI